MDLFQFAEQLKEFAKLKVENGMVTALTKEDKTPLTTPWSMSLEDIKAIDSRLPYAIEAQLTHNQSNNDYSYTVSASLLLETALYWTGTKLIPTDWGIIPYHKLCYFDEVKLDDERPRVVIVVLRCAVMPYTAKDGAEIKHVLQFGGMTRPVDIEWLDTKFPDWRNRYSVAVGLGYEGEELLNQVLTTASPLQSTPTSTDGITFD